MHFFELIPKSFRFDFIANRRPFMVISALTVSLSLVLFFVVGPRWSIDFTGGTEVELHFTQPTSLEELRVAAAEVGVAEDAIQQLGEESRFVIRESGASSARPEDVEAVRSALAARFGAEWVAEFNLDAEVGTRASVVYTGTPVSVADIQAALSQLDGVAAQGSPEENTVYIRLPGLAEDLHEVLDQQLPGRGLEIDRADSVGPKVGGALRTAGITSLLVTMAMLLVYVGIRFDFAFAPGAILCLFHDVIVTVGIFVLTRQEFGLSTISALLTLTGYSLNDTVVIYDRIRENMNRYRRRQFAELVNDSLNQTLSRTIMTAAATALALIPFLYWGGDVLRQFALCMLIGIVAGSWSTLFVATPVTIFLKDHADTIKRLIGIGPPDPAAAALRKPKPWEKARKAEREAEVPAEPPASEP